MATVRDMLRTKGFEVWAVPPDASVLDALKLMADKNIGAVLVMDSENLIGILSERDYARKVILHGKSSAATPAHEIMTERHRRSSMIVLSNRGPDEWLATFADPVRAQAAIDRFTSNSYDLVIEGESYRPRQKPTFERKRKARA